MKKAGRARIVHAALPACIALAQLLLEYGHEEHILSEIPRLLATVAEKPLHFGDLPRTWRLAPTAARNFRSGRSGTWTRSKTRLPYAGILLKKNEDLTAVKNAKNRVRNGYRW
ncbi:MAG: hypothetical protein ACLT9P_03270 [Evtepia gabavorous]